MSLLLVLPLLFLPIGLIIGGLLFLKLRDKRDMRRSPVESKALPNQAGAQVRKRLEDAGDAFWSVAAMALFAGPMIPLIVLIIEAQNRTPALFDFSIWSISTYLIILLGGVAVLLRQARRHVLTMRRCREGLAAELTTAHGLQSLIPEGLLVFHDLPADGFNIDHVVVAKSVVFAIETKSRKKPAATGKANARVQYDGKVLRFPEHVETKPLEQASRQARWLAEYLSGATGHPVRVIPVLALPGWYVEQTSPPNTATDEVRVINPKNPAFMHKLWFGAEMAEEQRRRIAWVLTKRYGDVDSD